MNHKILIHVFVRFVFTGGNMLGWVVQVPVFTVHLKNRSNRHGPVNP